MNIDNLRGKTILVGRDESNGRLAISLIINGQPKTAMIGDMNSVPKSVSRCKAKEGMAHCKIAVDYSSKVTVTNLKSQNVTFVNGMEIKSKKVDLDNVLELGKNRYSINVSTIMEAAAKIVEVIAPPTPKEFSIKPLEEVWNKYDQKEIELQKRPSEIAAAQSFPPILTLGSGALSAIAASLGFPNVCFVTIPLLLVGVILMIRNFYRRKNDTTVEERKENLKTFQDNYVCPNPDCKHFMGMQAYNILRQTKNCPYCKCRFNEK